MFASSNQPNCHQYTKAQNSTKSLAYKAFGVIWCVCDLVAYIFFIPLILVSVNTKFSSYPQDPS